MIFLPFLERFHPGIRAGRKTATTRSKPYGRPGEILMTPAGKIVLLEVLLTPLKVVRDNWWRQEGVSSPGEFVEIWCQIHPSGFDGEALKYLHIFRLVRDGDEEEWA